MAIRAMGCIESFGSGSKDRTGNEDAPTVDFLHPFSDCRSLWFIFITGFFCIPPYQSPDGKDAEDEIENQVR